MPKKKESPSPLTERDLQAVCDGLEEFGEAAPKRWYLHTGSLALDYAISLRIDGTGGYPGGCIVELFGEPSTGKSLMLAKAAAEAQKLDILPVIADAEGRWDDDFAEAQGVDPTKRRLFIPDTVEEFATTCHKLLTHCNKIPKQRILLILDSLAILTTLKEADDMEEGEMKMDQGRKAQRIRQAIRVLKSLVRSTGSIMIIANHVIANPGSYSTAKITPGGGGVPFQSSVRVELKKSTPIKMQGKDIPLGVQLHGQVVKNSVAPPFGACDIDVYWATGVDKYSGLVPIMEDLGIVKRHGAWYEWQGVPETDEAKKFQSSGLAKFIEENPAILEDGRWSKPYFLGGE
jgi:recombination protein RecA